MQQQHEVDVEFTEQQLEVLRRVAVQRFGEGELERLIMASLEALLLGAPNVAPKLITEGGLEND